MYLPLPLCPYRYGRVPTYKPICVLQSCKYDICRPHSHAHKYEYKSSNLPTRLLLDIVSPQRSVRDHMETLSLSFSVFELINVDCSSLAASNSKNKTEANEQ